MTKYIRNIRNSRLHAYDKSLLELDYYREYDDDPQDPPQQTQQIEFFLSALGIGDAVCGMYAACGIANAGFEVVFHTKHPDWLARVSHPGVTVVRESSFKADANLQYQNQHEHGANGTFPSRPAWYIKQLQRYYALPDCAPARPQQIFQIERVPHFAVLAPTTAYVTREWPLEHWRELSRLLRAAGARVTVLGAKNDGEKVAQVPADAHLIGASPELVLENVQRASLLIGNDSGMVHLAGLHGTPALALLGPTSRDFVFAHSDSVIGVTADKPCVGCYWRPANGFVEACGHGCPALRELTPQKVFTEAMNAPVAPQAKRPPRRVRREAAGAGHL